MTPAAWPPSNPLSRKAGRLLLTPGESTGCSWNPRRSAWTSPDALSAIRRTRPYSFRHRAIEACLTSDWPW